MSGHTPGPWTPVAERLAGERQWWVYADAAPVGHRLAAMCSGPAAKANAALIAAAPDMLNSLRGARLIICSRTCPQEWPADTERLHSYECDVIAQAIRRATAA